MKKMLSLLLLNLLLTPLVSIADDFPVHMEAMDMGVLTTGRPGKINLWYPQGLERSNNCLERKTPLCLADSAVTRKVVVFSHGAMGSAQEYSWLGESLAAAGYIVVGVNHYGESPVYGKETQDSRSSALTWQRPQDISALLDRLANANIFQKPVDWNRVIAIGHSAGGQTVALLAGARFDLHRLTEYCNSAKAQADLSCHYGRDRASAPEAFIALFNADYQDARIRKLILLDPALGSALQQDSLRGMALPSLIVGASHNDFLPWAAHGQRYAAAIPNSHTMLLQGQEGHFIFLDSCEHKVKVMGVALCADKPGVNRKAVQQKLIRKIVDFVRLDNEPVSVMQHANVLRHSQATFSHDSSLSQILLYTPRWVFALLAILCVFGWMQTRTRRVSVALALFLPAAMLVLSLTGVLRYFGWHWPALACWLLGMSLLAALCLKWMGAGIASYEAGSRSLLINGSWMPMLVILAIFITRYAVGVANAMSLEIAQAGYFPWGVSLLLGAWSGFFLARGAIFWRTKQLGESPRRPLPSDI
ncbi:alpha/beta hydrolase [Shewanella sp. AS16]|uniref:DUF6622 family protein n=1 Tax=Shewanella sp. AS16 TaxID=2907625 RepID=UPI001F2F5659|nr:DUF6622 family protein [Shewanella sp. AS16]MCE9687963.1 alpha/beta hydrolase [Shewanella sp. AS16]